jgi:hypothetical protein
MLKIDVLTECGRRLGDTSADFLNVLSKAFDFVVLELAQLRAIGTLTRTCPLPFASGTANQGVLQLDTGPLCGLAAPLLPAQLNAIRVPGWGPTQSLLQRLPDWQFEELWLTHGAAHVGRPQLWRTYPSIARLEVWPVPDSANLSASGVLEFVAPPATLADTDPIAEVELTDIPTLLAGLYRHGVKFTDETIRDIAVAENMWGVGVAAMKTRLTLRELSGRPIQIRYQDI